MELHDLMKIWAKARPASEVPNGPLWHPLVYHALDVAAVGELLHVRGGGALSSLRVSVGAAPERWGRLIGFLLSLHDLGKLSRPFQAQVPELWPEELLGPYEGKSSGLRHDAAGWILWDQIAKNGAPPPFAGWDGKRYKALLTPVFGHHGYPVGKDENVDGKEAFGDEVIPCGRAFVTLMHEVFQPDPLDRAIAPDLVNRASWPLAGLTVLADWIGSRQAWFPYREPDLTPAAYLEHVARPQAHAAVAKAGLDLAPPRHVSGYGGLTGKPGFQPSPVQAWAETVVLPQGPLLALIEDMTGGGKTEAAVMLAHRLIAEGRARGLYVALPTMATAKAMYDRLAKVYRRLFAEKGKIPSLALAHGSAGLDQAFCDSVRDLPDPERAAEDRGRRTDVDEPAGDESGAACAAWLADSRRKAFLAEVGVGTIDQALLAVLPAKYQSLRLVGLAGQVLIVDEAHAYDSYMEQELERLLTFRAALGGSAIVLSATLPLDRRQKLADAFAVDGLRAGPAKLTETDYPLAALVSGEGSSEAKPAARPGLPRPLTVTRLMDAEAAVGRIVAAARAGAAVAWVRNTVDDVFEAAALLLDHGLEPTIFHARAAMGDRLAVERGVVERFGKTGAAALRRCGPAFSLPPR